MTTPTIVTLGGEFVVIVNYNRPLSEMIADGNYDLRDSIAPEHFPIKGKGTKEVVLHLFESCRPVESDEVVEYLVSLGFKPAKVEHLLTFGAKYPNWQREEGHPIIALGSVWEGPPVEDLDWPSTEDGPRVLDLNGNNSERILRLNWYYRGGWDIGCRFLAFRK